MQLVYGLSSRSGHASLPQLILTGPFHLQAETSGVESELELDMEALKNE